VSLSRSRRGGELRRLKSVKVHCSVFVFVFVVLLFCCFSIALFLGTLKTDKHGNNYK